MAGGRDYDQHRFENLLLSFAERSRDDEGYGKVKLNKLLFRADFEAYRLLGASITGEEYKRQDLGPVAAHLPSALKRLGENGVLRVEAVGEAPYERLVPLLEEGHASNPDVFTSEELEIIDHTLAELNGQGAKRVSEWSHEISISWRVKQTNEIIPYSSALLSLRELEAPQLEALAVRLSA